MKFQLKLWEINVGCRKKLFATTQLTLQTLWLGDPSQVAGGWSLAS